MLATAGPRQPSRSARWTPVLRTTLVLCFTFSLSACSDANRAPKPSPEFQNVGKAIKGTSAGGGQGGGLQEGIELQAVDKPEAPQPINVRSIGSIGGMVQPDDTFRGQVLMRLQPGVTEFPKEWSYRGSAGYKGVARGRI